MSEIDVVDMTWIGAERASIAAVLAGPSGWTPWWPDLDLEVEEDRGPMGMRWAVRPGRGRGVAGSMEVYLHPTDDGVVAYFILRLDAMPDPLSARRRARLIRGYRAHAKQALWAISDRVDQGRLARVAAPDSAQRPCR